MLHRFIEEELESYLDIMPVVLMTGARQTGKTTLMELLCKERGYTFYTFDDDLVLSSATRDPSGWLASIPKPVIIDEVQRVPEIFLPIKRDVDQNRAPGRYLLTGSANPLLLPRLGDSLAGRMGIIPLYPFSQGEIREQKGQFIETIFAEDLLPRSFVPLQIQTLYDIILRGGFPIAQTLANLSDVNRWVRAYLQTMMERDVRDISNIEGLRELPRLFHLLATRTANLLNMADLSRSLGISQPTLKRYIRLLETLYFVYLLPAWYSNLGKRIIKSPKLHVCDTAILSQLLDINKERLANTPSLAGQLLESFVFTELQKLRSWAKTSFELFHFRDGVYEVDFVLEKPDGSITGIEVKSGATIRSDDFKGLKHLKKLAGKKFHRGIVLHLGHQMQQLEPNLWAMPIQSFWE